MRSVLTTLLQCLLALTLVALLATGAQRLHAPAQAAIDEPEAEPSDEPGDEHDEASATPEPVTAGDSDIADWQPDVDQVIDHLEDILVGDIPQQQMNYTMANLNAAYDTKLYLVFIDYLASLPPDQVKAALKEQKRWLRKRREETSAVYAQGDGGSLAPYNAGETYLQATRQRLDEISQRMPH